MNLLRVLMMILAQCQVNQKLAEVAMLSLLKRKKSSLKTVVLKVKAKTFTAKAQAAIRHLHKNWS